MPAKGAPVKSLLGMDLPADLAAGVVLGVDVDVRLAGAEVLDRRAEVRDARRLGEVLLGQLALLRQGARLQADRQDDRPGLALLAEVDVDGLDRAAELLGVDRVADRLAALGDDEARGAATGGLRRRSLVLAVQRRRELVRGGECWDGYC